MEPQKVLIRTAWGGCAHLIVCGNISNMYEYTIQLVTSTEEYSILQPNQINRRFPDISRRSRMSARASVSNLAQSHLWGGVYWVHYVAK